MYRCCERNNRKGTIVIFLCIIVMTLVTSTIKIVESSNQKASQSYLDGIICLNGRNILSEYDVKLKEDYGIFAFHATNKALKSKLKYYFEKNSGVGLVSYNPSEISLATNIEEYSILELDLLEKEILNIMKYEIFLKSYITNEEKDGGSGNSTLKNERIISSLPSRNLSGSGFKIDFSKIGELNDLESIIKNAGNKVVISKYITSFFKNQVGFIDNRESFFKNEVEYIICGKFSDLQNSNSVKLYLIEMRTPINIAKIYNDPERLAKAVALATPTGGGAASAATILAIVTAWAVADAKDDVNELIAGEKVDGLSYKDYLEILICLSDRETILLRILDIIQINLKGYYDENFLISEYYFGFRSTLLYKGQKYEHEHLY